MCVFWIYISIRHTFQPPYFSWKPTLHAYIHVLILFIYFFFLGGGSHQLEGKLSWIKATGMHKGHCIQSSDTINIITYYVYSTESTQILPLILHTWFTVHCLYLQNRQLHMSMKHFYVILWLRDVRHPVQVSCKVRLYKPEIDMITQTFFNSKMNPAHSLPSTLQSSKVVSSLKVLTKSILVSPLTSI